MTETEKWWYEKEAMRLFPARKDNAPIKPAKRAFSQPIEKKVENPNGQARVEQKIFEGAPPHHPCG